MKVTKEDLPEREVLLTIELESEDLEPYLERAYQRVVKRTNIPGFRKGKAPRAIVARFVGRDVLQGEALDFLLPEAVSRAVEEENLEPGGRPSVEVVEEDPVILKATVPLLPLVKLDDYRAIRVDEESIQIKKEQVQEVLEQLRRDQAPWEPADRAVASGDQVVMDVRGELDDRDIMNQTGTVYLVVEENPNPVPGFAKELIGLMGGQEREFSLTIPEENEDKELAGQQCAFHVVVHEIKEKCLADLDDEFARGVGEGYDNLEALQEKVRSDLQAQAEQAARLRYEDKVVQEVLDRATVETSPLLVEHEIDHLLADEEQALKRQQIDQEQYLQSVGKTAEEHREEARSVALSRLTRSYALREIAQLEGLETLPEDVEQEINSLVEAAGGQADSVRRTLDTSEGRQSLSGRILSRKTMERLVEIARGQQSTPADADVEEPKTESSQGGTEYVGKAG